MRLLAFFLFLGVVPVSATVFGQYAKVSLRVEKASLEKACALLIALGVLAGLAPAYRAMAIKPIEAIRDE